MLNIKITSLNKLVKDANILKGQTKSIKQIFANILNTKKLRWEDEYTTIKRKSYLRNHLISSSNLGDILGFKKDLLYGLLLHDICETVHGDVSVGLKNDMADALKKIGFFDEDSKKISNALKELQDLDGFNKVIKNLFNNVINFENINENIEELLFMNKGLNLCLEKSQIISFLEKFETDLLFLRKEKTEYIKNIIKKEESIKHILSYSLKPLIKVMNSKEGNLFNCEQKNVLINIDLILLNELWKEFKKLNNPSIMDKEFFKNINSIFKDLNDKNINQKNLNKLCQLLAIDKINLNDNIQLYNTKEIIFQILKKESDKIYEKDVKYIEAKSNLYLNDGDYFNEYSELFKQYPIKSIGKEEILIEEIEKSKSKIIKLNNPKETIDNIANKYQTTKMKSKESLNKFKEILEKKQKKSFSTENNII